MVWSGTVVSMLDRFSALNRFRALFYADGGSVLSRYTTVQRYCTVLLFISFPMTFHGSFYYQGLQVSRAWVVVHRRRQTWEFDTTLWPTNHFLTSSNVALHFKRKEINRPNLYNLWTQSKSWLDRLLKMGILVRLGECFVEKNWFTPLFLHFTFWFITSKIRREKGI